MRSRYGVEVALQKDDTALAVDQAVAVTLFRAVRELLINVAKHAKIGSAEVSLHRQNGWLKVVVADAGCGFDPSEAGGRPGERFGLVSVRERIGFLDGAMEIVTAPGSGTSVTLTVPLAAASAKEGGA